MNINTYNTSKSQIAAVLFAVIAIILIWQSYNIYPNIAITGEKIKNQEVTVNDSANTLKRVKEFMSFTEQNKEDIAKFDMILPSSEDKANLLSSLSGMASANGLNPLKITFADQDKTASSAASGVDAASPDFDPVSIKMSLRGSYFSFKNFLLTIEKNLRVTDIVSADSTEDTAAKNDKQGEKDAQKAEKSFSYNIELKTYLNKPLKEKDIVKLFVGSKFKDFSIDNLKFTKEKTFTDLTLSPDYNIDISEDEIGSQNIF